MEEKAPPEGTVSLPDQVVKWSDLKLVAKVEKPKASNPEVKGRLPKRVARAPLLEGLENPSQLRIKGAPREKLTTRKPPTTRLRISALPREDSQQRVER